MLLYELFSFSVLPLIVAAITINAVNQPQPEPLSAEEQLASMTWLAGIWRGDDFEANYSTPEGGLILSSNKFFADGKAVFYEFEKFEVRDGVLVMIPSPQGKESVPFALDHYEAVPGKAVFRNPEHDFPQSLTYEIAGPDNLLITVMGNRNGKEEVLRLNLFRVVS